MHRHEIALDLNLFVGAPAIVGYSGKSMRHTWKKLTIQILRKFLATTSGSGTDQQIKLLRVL